MSTPRPPEQRDGAAASGRPPNRGAPTDAARALVPQLAAALLDRAWTIATAESCTGGLLGALLTERPGSSRYFLGSVVAYANEAKVRLLGVPPALLAEHGAVSAAVAEAMAAGARRAFRAHVAVSITGIAGPDGGSPDKPVGLVYLGLATPGGSASRRLLLTGDRPDVRAQAAEAALAWLLAAATPGD